MKLLLDKIRNTKDCVVLPPTGLPNVNSLHMLPKDIEEFYTECGGIKFFSSSDYSIEIVAPEEMQLSNPIILPDDWVSDIPDDDISNDWYIVAQAGPEQRISIDLKDERVGKCYDSFWDIHATPGQCAVLAVSFTELLESILKSQGGYWFWLADDFVSLGDAYD